LLTATPVRTHCRHSSRNRYRLALIALGLALGCTRSNPAYLGPHPVNDGSMSDSGAGDAPPDVAIDMTVVDTGMDRGPDRTPDTGPGDTKIDTNKPDVKTDAADGGDGGMVNCIDLDGDGYGVGTGCLGPDCDDTNNAFHDTATRSCPAGAVNKGTCRAGSQTCTAGVWSICIGQVQATGEACNGEDDDCDGIADDNLPMPMFTCGQGACQNSVVSCSSTGMLGNCVPLPSTDTTSDSNCDSKDDDCDGLVDQNCPAVIAACVHVSPTGNDATATGGLTDPFQTIQAALASISPTTPRPICVAGGPTCQDQAIYTLGDSSGPFQMAPGVSIYGNYESMDWKRCALSPTAPAPMVTLALHNDAGVVFPTAINTPTALDGFVLTRNNGGSGTAAISAVTVNGAKQVRLANLVVNDTPNGGSTYGVDLKNGGDALITHCQISGGGGTMESIGVHSVGAKPRIRDNCSMLDGSGRCTTGCTGTPGLAIAGAASATNGTSTGVLLKDSPGASVETSTICGTQGLNASGVHIEGDATGTVVRNSQISASAGTGDSVGVRIYGCNNATPWIVGNAVIEGHGSKRSAGIVAAGACRPVIDGNVQISGGAGTEEADGVSCETDTSGVPSLCAVLGNGNIQGSSAAGPTTSAGVACKGHGCARVASNVVTGNAGNNVIGVWLVNDGTMVERNAISGGCGTVMSVGILANDSFARVQNNLVSAGACAVLATPQPAYLGMRVVLANDVNEMDIDSNTIDGGGATAGVCSSTALEYGSGNSPAIPPRGMIRNNILRGGVCLTARTDFSESSANTDPRLFQYNDLDPTGTPRLYLDENTVVRTSADMINGLTDIATGGNISANPMFVSFPTNQRLGTGSALKGAGTSTAAPANDFEGTLRSSTKPSIGAYE
jgi:hypothetical protein